ncbi:hypothetical protein [Rhodococcoides fascians]|uniref:hypothetical protein n=1 Tax=Rhodococcoides fascians TaxID=1828 RepID=UPI0037AE7B4D
MNGFGIVIDAFTSIGVLAAVAALYIQVRQRKFALAQQYIERYWQIDDSVMKAEDSRVDDDLRHHRRRYTKLCEDEMEIVSLGWIDKRTWMVWHQGLVSDSAKASTAETQAGFEYLSACRNSGAHDGEHCPAWLARSRWRRTIFR